MGERKFFFFSSRRRHTRYWRDWSSDVCSSDLKSDTVDVVLGLESGADDYVVKPFKPKELVARMRARLRRGEDAAPEMLTIGPPGNQITIDVPAHTVSRDGEEVKLTPLEFDLLVALARKPRQVFTREVLLEQVWGYRHAADTRLEIGRAHV